MRQTTVLGLVACLLAAASMVAVRPGAAATASPKAASRREPSARPSQRAALRQPAKGVGCASTEPASTSPGPPRRSRCAASARSSRWARYSHGVARTTSFGRETVVVTPEKTEQFMTVDRRQGAKTWRWRLGVRALAASRRRRRCGLRGQPPACRHVHRTGGDPRQAGRDVTPPVAFAGRSPATGAAGSSGSASMTPGSLSRTSSTRASCCAPGWAATPAVSPRPLSSSTCLPASPSTIFSSPR